MAYGWRARLAHYLAGIIAAASILIHPIFPALLTTVFILYELWEMIKIGDTGYLELREFGVGIFLGSSIILLSTIILHT